jgi:hypothetical protein
MPWYGIRIKWPWHHITCDGIQIEWPWHVMWPCHGIRILATHAMAIRFVSNARACDGIITCHAMLWHSNRMAMAWHHMPWPLDSNSHGIALEQLRMLRNLLRNAIRKLWMLLGLLRLLTMLLRLLPTMMVVVVLFVQLKVRLLKWILEEVQGSARWDMVGAQREFVLHKM